MAFPALLSFTSAGHGTEDECAIDSGFRLVGTIVTSTESVQTPFTIELWVSVDPASIPSPLESRPLAILVGSFPRWYVGLTRVEKWTMTPEAHKYAAAAGSFCFVTTENGEQQDDSQTRDMLEGCMATCGKSAGARARRRSRARKEASAQEVRGYYHPSLNFNRQV